MTSAKNKKSNDSNIEKKVIFDNRKANVFAGDNSTFHGPIINEQKNIIIEKPISNPIHSSKDGYITTDIKSPPESYSSNNNRISHKKSIIYSLILSAILSITTNIIASYLQERFNLLSNLSRFSIVTVIFLISLFFSYRHAIKKEQPNNY